jgi:hypothetical protein
MVRPAHEPPWSEVDRLFQRTLDLPAEERAAYLAEACGTDHALREAVLRLLGAVEASEGLFEGPRPEAVLAALDATARDHPDLDRIGRYRVVRRLARGGMGTVYLAERADGSFERRAAIKLLRRGLDTEDILARFRAERQILADLEHPNIARLLDGGSTPSGRPYLVMEYVAGAPITDYCESEGLDLEARLRLFVDVADAVHHAHAHGVIHRDLKPANIFVDPRGNVKLLDFGIARLLGDDPESTHTRTGQRLLTPDHASPEQVRGEAAGAASDVYQLGLLLYELLAGEPPYRLTGRSVTELERVVCREAVAPPSSRAPAPLRRRLRGDLDSIVLKALRKDPTSRYSSAEALALDIRRHLEGRAVVARSGARGYLLRHFARRNRVGLALAGGAAVVLLAAGLWPESGSRATTALDPGAVAVLPFRVSGADASLAYLREGMTDLLSTKLTGEGGPRAIAPATVLDAWRRASGSETRDVAEARALVLAQGVGAGQLLVGEVVGTPSRMILNASLLRVPGGEVAARATVQGPADSLLSVVDELTARLLVLGAGEELRPLGSLATTSLPALRAYLDGRVAVRGGRYDDAYDDFTRAVELDSTFALAAVRAYRAAWYADRSGAPELLRLAWQARGRLNGHDLAFVETMLGPNYPAPYSHQEKLLMRRRLVDMAPDRAEYRHMYADRLYHWHAILGIADGRESAAGQFRRALEADSSYTQAYQHLVPLLYSLGETREAERVARAYLRREPGGVLTGFLSWRMAAARGDLAALDELRAGFDTLAVAELLRIYAVAVQDTVEIADAERALRILSARAAAPAVRSRILRESFVFELLRGRPARAVDPAAKLRVAQAGDDLPILDAVNSLALTGLYGDGDSIAARRAVMELSARAFGPGGVPRPDARVEDLCTVAQWRLWHGQRTGVDAVVAQLRAADTSDEPKDTGPVCGLLLEAIDATLGRGSNARVRLARLDSALVTGPQTLFTIVATAQLAAADLHERQGDPAAALRAVRRRRYDFDSSNLLLATSLRTEGRLAAEVGDTEGAMRAYRHYLALRTDPEPTLQPQVDSVRAALAALERIPDATATP